MTARHLACALFACALGACNSLAGISDFREGDGVVTDAAVAGDAARDGDTGASNDAGPGETDATDAADEGLPPGCVPLKIEVVASPTQAYVGVDVHSPVNLAQSISAGDSRTICAAIGDAVELRGRPDNTSALHRWDGTTCGTASRCKFTMSGPVVATVHLQ